MNREKIEFTVIILVGIISGALVLTFSFKYVLPTVAPFIIAWAIALAVRRPAELMSRKLPIPERPLRVIMALILMLAVLSLASVGIWQGSAALWRFLTNLGENDGIVDLLSAITTPGFHIFGDGMPEELRGRIEDAFGQMLTSLLSGLAASLTSWVAAVPKALFFILVCAIAVIYFALDLEKINAWVGKILPDNLSLRLCTLKDSFFSICGKYLRAYLVLMAMTFLIMLVGFLILRIKDAVLIAFVVALVDVLPVIGVGVILVPWSVFALITGESALGIGLIVLFLVNTVIRQLAEPKIIGKNLDMHPILTLIMLYAGYALFGFLGLLLVPVASVVLGIVLNKDHTA